MTTQPTNTERAHAAMQRLTGWINRAAGQHRRAIRADFVEDRIAIETRTSAPTTPWRTTP